MKKTIIALVAGMLLVGPALAQNLNMNIGGQAQQRGTKKTTIKTMEIGPDGRPYEKEESINENLPIVRTNAKDEYRYSGIPGKFMRGKAAKGGQTPSQ